MFKWREPSRLRGNTCKNIRSEMKRPNDGDRTLPRKLLIEVALEIPHLIQDITIALGCLPELDGRTLGDEETTDFSHTWRNQVGTDRAASFLLASFQSPEGAVLASGEEKSSVVLPSCDRCELQ